MSIAGPSSVCARERWTRHVLAAALLLLLAARTPSLNPGLDWRFWTASDGLPESFVRKLSRGPDGRIWIRNGSVASMSILDGYSVPLIPEPRADRVIED